jgi:uncharacterized protein involved in exopolysaccharide biosynthesis
MFQPRQQIDAPSAGAVAGAQRLDLAPIAAIDFRSILSTLWQGKATIAFTTIAALVAAILFVLIVPYQYTAVTEILIDPTDLRAVENELSPSNQMSDAAVLQVESQVRVITSDSVLRRVVKTAGLDHDSEFSGAPSALRAVANGVLGLLGLSHVLGPVDPTLSALSELQRRTRVKRAERTYVVDVAVTSRDREKAARIANVVAQSYLVEQTASRSDAARRVTDSISARLSELKDRVRESEERAEAFKARNNIVNASGQLVNEQQLHDLNNQFVVARTRTAEAKARYEQLQKQQSNSDPGAFPEAVQSQTVTALRTQYAEVMRREAEQMTTLGARHPSVIEIRAQAQRLRNLIGEEINRLTLSARSEYESALASEQALARNLDAVTHSTLTTNDALVTLRELERDVQASRAVYQAYLVRARETGEQERLDTRNISIISKADLPLRRSWPPSNLILALGAFIFGVTAGTGIVLVRGPRDESERLSEASAAKSGGRKPALDADGLLRGADNPIGLPVLAVLPPVDERELSAGGEMSGLAAEMRKVYDAVRKKHTKRTGPRILVVASDDEFDATAVALSLAEAASRTQRVLLIDADLQRRTLAAIVDDQTQGGLVDVANGRKLLSEVVIRDHLTNINVMPFISPSSRRSGRINEQDIKSAFDQTTRFDVVIVAAMNWNLDPGARLFAGLVDHIVFVVRMDEVDSEDLERMMSKVNPDAGKVRGMVLTGAKVA